MRRLRGIVRVFVCLLCLLCLLCLCVLCLIGCLCVFVCVCVCAFLSHGWWFGIAPLVFGCSFVCRQIFFFALLILSHPFIFIYVCLSSSHHPRTTQARDIRRFNAAMNIAKEALTIDSPKKLRRAAIVLSAAAVFFMLVPARWLICFASTHIFSFLVCCLFVCLLRQKD